MTPEEIQTIENYRTVITSGSCSALLQIAKKYNGYTTTACFCSSSARKIYHNGFYVWYDALTPTETNE